MEHSAVTVGSGYSYRKKLGLFELVSLGIGGTVGSGIFVVPGIAAGIAGPYALVAWGIAAISATPVMLCLAWTISRYPETGAFYSIFERVFGRRASAGIVALYLVSSIFGISTIAAGIGQYLTFFGLPQILFFEFAIIALFCVVNVSGVYLSGMTENALTLLKIVPLVALALFLIPFVKAENLVAAAPVSPVALMGAITIVYWSYTGFEISAIPVGEIRDIRLISRALILVMISITGLYLLLNISLLGSLGAEALAASPAPIALAAGVIFKNSSTFVAAVGIVAMASALNAYILGTSRVIQSISREYRIPVLCGISPSGVPLTALVLSSALSAALLLFSNSFFTLASISVVTNLIPYILLCIAAFVLLRGAAMRVTALFGAAVTTAILLFILLIGV